MDDKTRENKKIANKVYVLLRGNNEKSGVFNTVLIYFLLVGIGYVYMYPLIYMLTQSLMNPSDLVDPTVAWLPTQFFAGNFIRAWSVLEFPRAFMGSFFTSLAPALAQTLSLAIAAYGLARFEFPLKKFWLVMIVAVFIIPSQVTMIPDYVWFKSMGIAGTVFASILPALFAQGIKSPIFILIFYQVYRSYPQSLDEAASIDGAGRINVFIRVALPMAASAVLVCFLFSFIWYWNETTRTSTFFEGNIATLPLKLNNFVASYTRLFPANDFSTTNRINESIRLAGTLLTISPMLAMYIFLQRYFIEGIERTGITGE